MIAKLRLSEIERIKNNMKKCTHGKGYIHQYECPVHYYLEGDGRCTCVGCPPIRVKKKSMTPKEAITRLVAQIRDIREKKISPREEEVIKLLRKEYPTMSYDVAMDWSCEICFNGEDVVKVFKRLDRDYER